MRNLIFLFGLFFISFLGCGKLTSVCSKDIECHQDCVKGTQCQSRICIEGRCSAGCRHSDNCTPEEVCFEHKCLLRCADGQKCPDGQVCSFNGKCRDKCKLDEDCLNSDESCFPQTGKCSLKSYRYCCLYAAICIFNSENGESLGTISCKENEVCSDGKCACLFNSSRCSKSSREREVCHRAGDKNVWNSEICPKGACAHGRCETQGYRINETLWHKAMGRFDSKKDSSESSSVAIIL